MAKDWVLISFIKRSRYREMVLKILDDTKTPTQLSKLLKIHKAHISVALKTLIKKGLVICYTPGERKYKIFGRTRKGDEILKSL